MSFTRKIITKQITWAECREKWSEYYTCKRCEDEVNLKGHLTKPQDAVHVENDKKQVLTSRNS